jgi:sorting nexin-8
MNGNGNDPSRFASAGIVSSPDKGIPGRTTSTFTTDTRGDDPVADSIPQGTTPMTGNIAAGWDYFDGNPSSVGSGFNDQPSAQTMGQAPFGAANGSLVGRAVLPDQPQPTLNGPNRVIPPGGRTGSALEEHIVVVLMPEKEGMFMFQHHNYEVSSSRRGSKVIRRYSDFVWLLDCLHKRYPFRALPLLPPKRVAGKCILGP